MLDVPQSSKGNGAFRLLARLFQRQEIEDGTLVRKDGFYRFTRDYEFSSPSAAAAVIEGGSANGLVEWKTQDGRILKALDEQA